MSRAYNAAYHGERKLSGENLTWCFDFENKLETLKVLNIIGNRASDENREHKQNLEQYIKDNGAKYKNLTITI